MLERLEAWVALRIERHDLPVDYGVLCFEPFPGLCDFRIGAC